MESKVEVVGAPCGSHGPYTFYKAFKYRLKDGSVRILSLCEFFLVKLWSDSDLVCIGELQLLWLDKNLMQMLASLRLYFLPEHTPDGRANHGEDEVLAISEKVVLRVEDLLTWISLDIDWNWGLPSVWSDDVPSPPPNKTEEDEDPLKLPKDPLALGTDEIPQRRGPPSLTDGTLDFTDVEKERLMIDESWRMGTGILVLSYPRYCRYRALMKRLEAVEDRWLKNTIVQALGGFSSPCRSTRVLFCKDTFDYPELEGHELLCNHLAPKLKGRPRGKRKKRSLSPGSESNESEASVSYVKPLNGLSHPRRSTRCSQSTEEREFLGKLSAFMKSHKTPIGKIPQLGTKELDLYQFWLKVQKFGGYDRVTAHKLWKVVYDYLGGNQSTTSVSTVMRRYYERFLLQFERKIRGEQHKPLPVSERRRLKVKAAVAAKNLEETEPEIEKPVTPNIEPIDKVFTIPEKKSDGKTSSLRSVRVKPDRIRLDPKPVIPPSDITDLTTISPKESTPPLIEINLIQKDETQPNSPIENVQNVDTVVQQVEIPTSPPVVTPVTPSIPTVPISMPSPAAAGTDVEAISPVATIPPKPEPIPSDDDDDEPIEIPYKPQTPEIIDLGDDSLDEEIKIPGLEITPVTSVTPLSMTSITVTPVPSAAPITITPVAPITVTPITVTPVPPPKPPRILPAPDIQYTKVTPPIRVRNSQEIVTPPKVIQSRSIYTPENTVYGNPKETIPISRIGKSEVLDLRVKPTVPSRFQLPSNLEITLVNPPPKKTKTKENGRRTKEKQPIVGNQVPQYPNYLSQLSAMAAKNPFLPMLDPSLYYSALAQGLYPPTNPLLQSSSLPITPPMYPPRNPIPNPVIAPLPPKPPTPEQLQLYKEMMKDSSKLHLLLPFLQENARITSGSTPNK